MARDTRLTDRVRGRSTPSRAPRTTADPAPILPRPSYVRMSDGMIDKPFVPLVPSDHSPPVGDGWRGGRADRGRSPDGERPGGDERMTRSSGATKGSPMQNRQAIDVRATDFARPVT